MKTEAAIKGLKRLKEDFKMIGSNAVTIERAIQRLKYLDDMLCKAERVFNSNDLG